MLSSHAWCLRIGSLACPRCCFPVHRWPLPAHTCLQACRLFLAKLCAQSIKGRLETRELRPQAQPSRMMAGSWCLNPPPPRSQADPVQRGRGLAGASRRAPGVYARPCSASLRRLPTSASRGELPNELFSLKSLSQGLLLCEPNIRQ